MKNATQYQQDGRYEMSVTEAEYDEDGSLHLSLTFSPQETPPLDELLTTGYVKVSVYDNDEFVEKGMLTLYDSLHC
ncbi:hypothetical protein ACFFQF_15785 [Haladaptatus pallidirubidus]|uniref:Uncharacterized protein n=2 Tax=Haladaptatus pallidirubidus TaxID=1008152 RepID=A0AAV3UBY1_9EURY